MGHPETDSIRIQTPRSQNREHSTPLYLTSSFVFDDADQARATFAEEIEGNIYSRYSNPNSDEFIDKMCRLEKAESGVAFASGMAAVFTSLAALLQSGDHILVGRSVFGSTHQLLTKLFPKWGITFTYGDLSQQDRWEDLIRPNTKMIFVESPSNPGLDLVDLEMLRDLRSRHNLILNVDNCFATPYLQNPTDYDADLIIHSATKYIDGQGRVLGGVVVGREELIAELRFFIRNAGPSLSPFNAWVLSKSLETLGLRMERHCSSAQTIAERLEGHPDLSFVRYPFLPSHPQYELAKRQMRAGGGIITLELKGGFEHAQQFMDKLKIASITSNLGDSRTIVTHPASTTHARLTEDERLAVGITPGLVRLSVGLENVDDLIADLLGALKESALASNGAVTAD